MLSDHFRRPLLIILFLIPICPLFQRVAMHLNTVRPVRLHHMRRQTHLGRTEQGLVRYFPGYVARDVLCVLAGLMDRWVVPL